jgi:hypothetical protein
VNSYRVDNIDPQSIGKTPKDCGIDCDSWGEAEKQFPEETEETKTKFRNDLLASLLCEVTKNEHSLQDICKRITDYCWNLTNTSRQFMETNANKKLPSDYLTYPGKMDHTTVVALRVGPYI